eukprot:7390212-Prymnesium_polylepis.3
MNAHSSVITATFLNAATPRCCTMKLISRASSSCTFSSKGSKALTSPRSCLTLSCSSSSQSTSSLSPLSLLLSAICCSRCSNPPASSPSSSSPSSSISSSPSTSSLPSCSPSSHSPSCSSPSCSSPSSSSPSSSPSSLASAPGAPVPLAEPKLRRHRLPVALNLSGENSTGSPPRSRFAGCRSDERRWAEPLKTCVAAPAAAEAPGDATTVAVFAAAAKCGGRGGDGADRPDHFAAAATTVGTRSCSVGSGGSCSVGSGGGATGAVPLLVLAAPSSGAVAVGVAASSETASCSGGGADGCKPGQFGQADPQAFPRLLHSEHLPFLGRPPRFAGAGEREGVAPVDCASPAAAPDEHTSWGRVGGHQ